MVSQAVLDLLKAKGIPAPTPYGNAAPRLTTRPRAAIPVESLHPCRFLLPILSRTDAAGLECSCPGKWLRGCQVHGQCRIDQESVDGCCRTCEQRQV